MLIWFAVMSVLMVAIVFRSAGLDYRTVILGSVLPVGEAAFGGPRVLHSVVGAVAVLTLVMLATPRRRLIRRSLLGIPIGLMCHLVLDGSFTSTAIFWWPIPDTAFADGQVPELDHLWASLALEITGVAIGLWAWGQLRLADPAVRRRFLEQGRLALPDG